MVQFLQVGEVAKAPPTKEQLRPKILPAQFATIPSRAARALAQALSRADFSSERNNEETRLEEYPRYFVESRALPADADGVIDLQCWDEPIAPFAKRLYRPIEVKSYVALWGEVLGYSGPVSAATKPKVHLSHEQIIQTRRVQSELKTDWTPDECRAEGLPMYRSKQWFIEEYERLGSLAAMEAAHGYSNQRLSEWGKRYELDVKPRITPQVWETVTRLRAQGLSAAKIAKEVNISKQSVLRLIRKQRGLLITQK